MSIVCFSQETLPRKYREYHDGLAAYQRNCGVFIGKNYLKKALNEADFIVLAFNNEIKHLPRLRSQTTDRVVAGFAFLKRSEQNGLYVDLICSNNRLGKAILSRIERKAQEIGAEFVDLNALDNALPFYERNGYQYVRNPTKSDPAHPCKMSKPSPKHRARKRDEMGYLWRMAKCVDKWRNIPMSDENMWQK